MEGLELKAFQIISQAGNAKSLFFKAIEQFRQADFIAGDAAILEGVKELKNAHKVHFEMIQEEARGEKLELNLLLVHAEDQLMAASHMEDLSKEMKYLYQMIYQKKENQE
ncbi:MAG: PTS lactose/cellobiose transporter subunit IIA [Erysipelotrichaceae bacterium]|jgi:PTS system cellobiose-specific IIA component|nr:PTS lactose/cellobiose transporter subunit IIA [Erysipelotrichaceae bacterium]